MKKQTVIGLCVGIAVGTAAAVASALVVRKIVKEIKADLNECSFTSPDGDNEVTLTYGSSAFAKGLTFIKVKAVSEMKKDDCTLIAFAKKSNGLFSGEWVDNDHFELLIGNGKFKQHCDVSFDDNKIKALYYLHKFKLSDSKKNNKLSVENN